MKQITRLHFCVQDNFEYVLPSDRLINKIRTEWIELSIDYSLNWSQQHLDAHYVHLWFGLMEEYMEWTSPIKS